MQFCAKPTWLLKRKYVMLVLKLHMVKMYGDVEEEDKRWRIGNSDTRWK
jgi:hypothetical protein